MTLQLCLMLHYQFTVILEVKMWPLPLQRKFFLLNSNVLKLQPLLFPHFHYRLQPTKILLGHFHNAKHSFTSGCMSDKRKIFVHLYDLQSNIFSKFIISWLELSGDKPFLWTVDNKRSHVFIFYLQQEKVCWTAGWNLVESKPRTGVQKIQLSEPKYSFSIIHEHIKWCYLGYKRIGEQW